MLQESVEKTSGTEEKLGLSDWVRKNTAWILGPISKFLAKTGITPNALTVIGFLLNAAVGVVLATGHVRGAGLLLCVASAFDALDGALARASQQTTRFGAFLDSVLDRFSESAVLLGMGVLVAQRHDMVSQVLVYAAIVGSLMVSYARARAEGIGVECKVGFGTRFERVLILIVGLLGGWVRGVLWVLAILANFTALQRIVHVWRATRGDTA